MKINKAVKQALALLATIALTTIGAATANAGNVINTWQDLNSTISDSCTGENFPVSGKVHIQENTTTNPNGTFHVHVTENAAGLQGVGPITGTKYQIPIVVSETVNMAAGQEMTLDEIANVISDGSSSNEQLRIRMHITMNANGVVTVDNMLAEITCTP